MACGSCSAGSAGKPGGCNGSCSGGCNRMNTFDWLNALDIVDTDAFDLVEVSFKKGAHKDFFHNPPFANAATGDEVLVEIPGGGGYDVGTVSLCGDMVKMQLKKKNLRDDALFLNVIRKANARDSEKLKEIRVEERDMMIRARAISRSLNLDMKIGDVEIQGDGRKSTFFYTADGRIDFRELIRSFAKEFKIKIEMRQIGARQESARIGGIGSCGRELCCSTWLSDFKSVSTVSARYQQLAINQAKLSGMCGRLKCCLNYELDSYLDALEDFPQNPDRLFTKAGRAELIKTDVFKAVMTFVMAEGTERGKFFVLSVSSVKEVLDMNKRGEQPVGLHSLQYVALDKNLQGEGMEERYDDVDYSGEGLVGAIELPDDRKRNSGKKKFEIKRNDNKKQESGTASPKSEVKRPNDRGNERTNDRNAPQQQRPHQRPPQNNPMQFKPNAPRSHGQKPQDHPNQTPPPNTPDKNDANNNAPQNDAPKKDNNRDKRFFKKR